MGRSSIRRHKQNLLIDRVFFQSAENITQRYTCVFVGKRQLVTDNYLRAQTQLERNIATRNTNPIIENSGNKQPEIAE